MVTVERSAMDFTVVNRQTRETMDVSEATVRKAVGDENIDNMIEGKLTEEGLKQTCLASNKNYSTMRAYLNRRITDAGDERTVSVACRSFRSFVDQLFCFYCSCPGSVYD